MRDRFRDPFGWMLDRLPWRIRRFYFGIRLREWPIPEEARLIGCRRPSQLVVDYFRRLHGLDGEHGDH